MTHSFEEYEKMKAEIKKDIMNEITPTLKYLGESMFEIKQTLAPMAAIFESAQGFNIIAVWFIKFVIGLGATVGIIYGAIKWLKQ